MRIKSTIQNIKFSEGLKVGVISDSQLSPFANDKVNTYQSNLFKSLLTLKQYNCNVILFAGDICNMGSKYAYRRYKDCFKKAFSDKQPLVISIMGNHDYYSRVFPRRLFEKELGQNPYTHYVLNGFHFIGLSPDCMSMFKAYSKAGKWLDSQLEIACQDNPDRPVFVITHHPPQDTVYGSDDWGDKTLDKVFCKYKNVVDFAGHSHYSLLDERSYYQGKYRVFNTQSVSYIELERGKKNGSVPPEAHVAPMGYVLEFNEDKIDVLRVNLLTGEEQLKDRRWSIPYDTSCKEQNQNENKLPSMSDCEGKWYSEEDKVFVNFAKGKDKDFVHSYKLVFSDGDVQYYFSDFYKGIENMSNYQNLRIFDKEKGEYDIKVYAVNSYGKESPDYTLIKNVTITQKDSYKRKLAPDIWY